MIKFCRNCQSEFQARSHNSESCSKECRKQLRKQYEKNRNRNKCTGRNIIRKRIWTLENLNNAVKDSFSVAATLRKLGLNEFGCNHTMFKRKIKEFNIDISHFTGQGHLRGKTHNWSVKKYSTEEILRKDSLYRGCSSNLKQRLLKEKIFQEKCYECNLTEWRGQKISVELHHINGDNTDHRRENLILLCPNCHSLTDNYCSKNKR